MFKTIGATGANALRQITDFRHARRRRRERARHDRLYPPMPAAAAQVRLGYAGQAGAIDDVVSRHCARGSAIVRLHDTARTKLDAVDYALSTLMQELREVMGDLPRERMAEASVPTVRLVAAPQDAVAA